MNSDERAKIFEEQAKEIIESFLSHTEWTYKPSEDGKRWHKKCCKDYAAQLYRLTKLL